VGDEGTPGLLCLHGWGLNAAVWEPLAASLPGGVQVLAPDLPGHGARASEARFGGLDEAADRMAALLDAPATVVGWSLGGLLALTLAGRHPGKVARVVLVAATPRFVRASDWPCAMRPEVLDAFARDLALDYRATLTRFLALQVHGLPERAQTLRALKARCLQAPPHPKALAEGLDILRDTDLRPLLAALEMPVHAVLGSLDTLVPSAVAGELRRLRPGIRVAVLAGAGHAPLLSHPAQVAEFLTEVVRG
jgi:pimeloyl-[acyl-carrier protein] methyl ester esterase